MPALTTLVDGTVPVAADFNGNFSALNAAIGTSTVISAWATGEIPYASAANTLARLVPGSTGQVLTIAGGIPAWAGGAWTQYAYNAGDFTATGSMTWTVDSGDVEVLEYLIIGKTMTVIFRLKNTTVGGTPSTTLLFLIPAGKVANKGAVNAAGLIIDNGARGSGYLNIDTSLSATQIRVDRTDGGNWSASTNNTGVYGQLTFETT